MYGFRIDSVSGALSALPPLSFSVPGAAGPESIAVHPTGKFAYVANVDFVTSTGPGWVSQFKVDSTTGVLTPIGTLATNGHTVVAVEPSGKFAYVTEGYLIGGGTDQVQVFAIDPLSGNLTPTSAFATAGNGSAAITILRRLQ